MSAGIEMNKTTDAYGDMMRDKIRDEYIVQSQELIQECKVCVHYDEYHGWLTTDGRHFSSKETAINWQYDLLRKGVN